MYMIDAFFAAEIDDRAETIDLHGMGSVAEALPYLEQELYRVSQSGVPYCKVVHGIGTGVLRSAVQEALKKNPLVVDMKLEPHGGSTIVIF